MLSDDGIFHDSIEMWELLVDLWGLDLSKKG
jgi:hypothetical protein